MKKAIEQLVSCCCFPVFYVPPASLRGHYGVDIPAFYDGGRPQVPLRAIFSPTKLNDTTVKTNKYKTCI